MKTRSCRTKLSRLSTTLLAILLGVWAVGGLLPGPTPATAADSGGTEVGQICMQRVFMGPTASVSNSNALNCTAEDVKIAEAISAINLDTGTNSCIEDTFFTLQATFRVNVTANIRYDEGFFFRIDGGTNARGDGTSATGTCSVSFLNPAGAPGTNLDGDTCGDLSAGSYDTVTYTIPNVKCQNDGTNHVRLPNCVSWHSNQGTVCTAGNEFTLNPDTKSKCTCNDNFSIPILVESATITVVKDANPTSMPEPGGSVTYTVGVSNKASFTPVTLHQICDDRFGNVVTEVTDPPQPPCAAGTLGSVTSTTCTMPQTLTAPYDPGTPPVPQYSCTFTADVTGDQKTVVDTVTVNGTTGTPPNTKPVTGSDTAQVVISDVPPTMTVTKAFDSLQCVTLKYKVTVTNNDPVDSLTVSALVDDRFGDITTNHGSISNTTCTLANMSPIGVGGSKNCTFDASFCASSTTDTVTATATDDDGNPVTGGTSNCVPVTVCTATTTSTTCTPTATCP
jgi:hypothetical protein